MPYNNNNCDCRMDDIEYTIVLNEQGPQGRQGRQGEDGFSPSITVSVDTPSVYQLTITTKDQVINTPNLKANIPDPTFNGAVLTVNEDAALGYAWQELPWARTDQRGTVQLATDSDLTPDPETGYNDVVPTIEQLADEIANRTTADTTLQSNITAEQSAREAADTALQTNIDNEANARQEADTTLQINIDTLEQSLDEGLATKQDTLTAGTNIEITSENVINNTYTYTLPQATAETLGGIKANARTENDTQEIKIDTETGILYTTPTGGTGGTGNYNDLENKPSINNVTLQGNVTLEQLGVQAAGDYVTTNTEQDITSKKNFTQGASLSFTSKLTADDGMDVNEYDLIYSNGILTGVGDNRLNTTIHSAGEVEIERYNDEGTLTTYTNIDAGNLSENVQPLLTNLATKDELDDYLTKADAADTYATGSEVEELGNELNSLAGTVTGLETSKQDVLTAGANIQITNNTISATDTTYTAGDGITIEGNVISATGGSGELELEAQLPLEITQLTVGNIINFQQNEDGLYYSDDDGRVYSSFSNSKVNFVIGYKTSTSSLPPINEVAHFLLPYKLGQTIAIPRNNIDLTDTMTVIYGKILDDGSFYPILLPLEFDYYIINEDVTPVATRISSQYYWNYGNGTYIDTPSSTYVETPNSTGRPRVFGINIENSQLISYTNYEADRFRKYTLDINPRIYEINAVGLFKRNISNVPADGLYGSQIPEGIDRVGVYTKNITELYTETQQNVSNFVWTNLGNRTQDISSSDITTIKLNYDNTLTLNDNQLSVNTSGLDIPTSTSQLTNDSGFITKDVNDLTNYTPTSGLATVATTGSYNDLQDKPTIPSEYTLPIASTTTLGGVKPDGTTITVTSDGTISAVGGGGGSGDNYVTLDTEQDVGSYKTFTNGVFGYECYVQGATWSIEGGCLLGERNTDTQEYIPYIIKANPLLGGNVPNGLYIGNPAKGMVPTLTAVNTGQENYEYPQVCYPSEFDFKTATILDTFNFEHIIQAGEGISITNQGGTYVISGSGSSPDVATLSGNNTFTGDNTFSGSVTVGGGAVVTANNVGTYAATTTQGINADTAIANLNGFKFWSGTQSEYDGLAAKDNTTLYIITGD